MVLPECWGQRWTERHWRRTELSARPGSRQTESPLGLSGSPTYTWGYRLHTSVHGKTAYIEKANVCFQYIPKVINESVFEGRCRAVVWCGIAAADVHLSPRWQLGGRHLEIYRLPKKVDLGLGWHVPCIWNGWRNTCTIPIQFPTKKGSARHWNVMKYACIPSINWIWNSVRRPLSFLRWIAVCQVGRTASW